jgi:deoxyribonuclease IV
VVFLQRRLQLYISDFMIRLGFHLSIAGAIANAPIEAISRGYDAFQIFTTSSRSWKNSVIDPEDASKFKEYVKVHSLMPYAHIPYLCNPASTNEQVYASSKEMLVNNIKNCNLVGIDYLIIHLGSHLGKGTEIGIANVCNALTSALDATKNVNILLENSSSYKNCVGGKFSEIGQIVDTVGSDRIGVCFDTCHAFASGYDLRNDEAVEKTMGEFDSYIKLSRLKLVHLNDAKYPLASGLDRHFHIGKGYIGKEGFTSLFRNKAFKSGSFVMELPEDDEGDHGEDMSAVKEIIGQATG